MKQKDLAKKLGISRTYLNGIVKKKRIPGRELAKKIAKNIGKHWLDFRPQDKELLKELMK